MLQLQAALVVDQIMWDAIDRVPAAGIEVLFGMREDLAQLSSTDRVVVTFCDDRPDCREYFQSHSAAEEYAVGVCRGQYWQTKHLWSVQTQIMCPTHGWTAATSGVCCDCEDLWYMTQYEAGFDEYEQAHVEEYWVKPTFEWQARGRSERSVCCDMPVSGTQLDCTWCGEALLPF